MKTKKRFIDIFLFILISTIIISFIYIRYLLLVNEGKAVDISILKSNLIEKEIELEIEENTIDSLSIKIEDLENQIEEG